MKPMVRAGAISLRNDSSVSSTSLYCVPSSGWGLMDVKEMRTPS